MGFVTEGNLGEYTDKLVTKLETIFATKEMVGAPRLAATVAAMTDTTKIYVYTGTETGYVAGNWYYHDGTAWTSGGVYNSTAFSTDPTLSVSGAAADAAAVGAALRNAGGRWTDEAVNLLLSLLRGVERWTIPNVPQLLDDLEDELAVATVVSITAVFTQGAVVVHEGDSLDSLKQYLVVTAAYSDGTTAAVTGYTLSGTLATGTSAITVDYNGMTDSFNVTVSAASTESGISAVYTQGATVVTADTPLDDLKAGLVVTLSYSDSTSRTLESSEYTLSGTLSAGTSTVTVTRGSLTDTFSVTVTADTIQRCEWIANIIGSAADNYIVTDIKPKNSLGYKLELMYQSDQMPSGGFIACGARNSASGNDRYWVYVEENGNLNIGWNTSINTTRILSAGYKYTIKVNYQNDRKIYVNDTQKGSINNTLASFGSSRRFVILGRDTAGSLKGNTCVFYGIEFTDGENVVANFVPAYKTASGEIGVLETVSNTFYGNSGSGNGFTKGSDVSGV